MRNYLGAAVVLSLALFTGACLETRADDRLPAAAEEKAKRLIVREKCGSCHRLEARGLELRGTIGPDLTHQAQRQRPGSWLLRKLTDPTSVPDGEVAAGFAGKQKLMPSFGHLSRTELDLLVRFLHSLD